MKKTKIHRGIVKKILMVALVVVSNTISFALKPGDAIPSQKLDYIDPVSGNKCARLTTMGVANHTTIYCGQDSSAETRQWSADSKSVILWFGFGDYPVGVYLMNVETGGIKYLAPLGNSKTYYNHAVFNPKDPDEIVYEYSWKGETSFVEIRGVKTSAPYTVRTIKRFDGISRAGSKISMSHEGKFCYVMVYSPKGRAYGVVFDMLTQEDVPDFPYRGPDWDFKDNSLQDGCLWNPVNNKAILFQVPLNSTTEKKKVCYDFDQRTSIPHGCATSHATWSADGTMTASPFGVISEKNQCLGADGKTGAKKTEYYTPPHPYANPAEAALGENGHIIGDCVNGLNWDAKNVNPRYIYYFTWKELKTIPWATILTRPQNRIGLWWGDHSANPGHPHMQISPNGKYVVWVSNVKNRVLGNDNLPPGPKNTRGKGSDVDVFMMELDSGHKAVDPEAAL